MALEQAVAGPLASRHLADLGARVVKVERPGVGDFARHYDRAAKGQSSHFVWLNRGKESVELDLKSDDDRELLWRLLAKADVVLANLSPGALDRLGLGAGDVRARHPGLVYCSISGYGEGGPYGHRKAYDLLIQAEAGLLSITGTPDEPAKAGISVADIAAGMYAFSGVLAALFRRAGTGSGATLQISLLDALAEWMGYPLTYAGCGSAAPPRSGARHATIAPYGPFMTGSGEALLIAVQNDREWKAFCETVLGDPALAEDPGFATNPNRIANRARLEELIARVFAGFTWQGATELLDRAGVAHARMRDLGEVIKHPQLLARGRWATAGTSGGPLQQLVPPIDWDSEAAPRELPPVPALGEHNATIRAEFAL